VYKIYSNHTSTILKSYFIYKADIGKVGGKTEAAKKEARRSILFYIIWLLRAQYSPISLSKTHSFCMFLFAS
jgi:hypothetical protein